MGKLWKAFSGLADVIQVASFGGVTLGAVVASITALAGYSSQLPWFWILVSAALLAWTAIFLFDRFHLFQKVRTNVPPPPVALVAAVEYVSISDVAREVYGRTRGTGLCDFIESVATRNGKLEHGTVLDVCATYIANTTVPIFGKHTPSIEWEKLDESTLKRGRFENGSFHRYGNDDPEFTQISILAGDRNSAVNQIIELAASEEKNKEVSDFEHGFNRATFQRMPTRDAALLRLTQLRSEGVVIRNNASQLLFTSDLDAWVSNVSEWMKEAIEAIKPVSEPDSVWFATLGEVPAARVPIPNVRLGGDADRTMFVSIFRQHDYRLARLDALLKKNGIGA